jgi:hypothetical protein
LGKKRKGVDTKWGLTERKRRKEKKEIRGIT